MKSVNINVSSKASNAVLISQFLITLTLISTLASTLVGCGSASKAPNVYKENDNRPLVDSKYSLSADRKQFEELRAEVPEDRRHENDESALILDMVSDTKTELKRPPSEIRSKFDTMLRKKREIFNKDMGKEREIYTKAERKKRETFLKEQQEARGIFNREKQSRERKNEYYKELDARRTEFFSTEREKRADFESDVRERRKSFEDYTREKTGEFNQELKAYQKRYDEAKKQREAQLKTGTYPSPNSASLTPSQSFSQQTAEAAALERELEELRGRPGTALESGE